VPGENTSIGGTGMPVAIQMSLQFQETTYLTKNKPNERNAEISEQYRQAGQVNEKGEGLY